MTKQFQTALIDTLIVLLLAVFAMLIVAAAAMNKPTKNAEEAEPANSGTLTVVATWDNARDDDIDLWIQGPDGPPVGFTQKHGIVIDLLRDDLGKSNDPGQINMENAYSRGAPAGEYTVTLHWYRGIANTPPEIVHVIVALRKDPNASLDHIWEGNVTIPRVGIERHAITFKLDGNMAVVSKSQIPRYVAQPSSGGAVVHDVGE